MSAPSALGLSIPRDLGADRPPEDRGLPRDGVRLLVSRPDGESHHRFSQLPELLDPGDLLVVNESATLPASLPARAAFGDFRASLSTPYGPGFWLVEPRWSFRDPGPLPLRPGDRFEIGGLPADYVASFPGIPRLGFVRVDGDLASVMRRGGQPIRYGYLAKEYPLETFQTVFARVPGSAEMPSAGRPFTRRLLERLADAGVEIARIVLHAGVSSLEWGDAESNSVPTYPEPFEVPPAAVAAIGCARARRGRVIAVGTTVVRALESATYAGGLRPTRGFTQVCLGTGRPARGLDGLLTGFHEASSSHVALLESVMGAQVLRRAYGAAVEAGYLWHEFGDSHLFLTR